MSYSKLQDHFACVGQLEEVAAIAGWDQAVNMPAAAGESRARALAALTRVIHEKVSDSRIGDWLEVADHAAEGAVWERANLREMRRRWRRAVAIPADLVQASAEADKLSETAWRQYRAENNFEAYAPYLKTTVSLKRQIGEALADVLGCTPYEALADEYEPDIRTVEIDAAFAPLKAFLPTFTEQVIERQLCTPVHQPRGPFPVDEQRELGLTLMRVVGFAMERGRLDVSHHPFCGGVPGDVRMTTRYDESDFTSALMGVLHEAGHAKYEQGLPNAWVHQPVGLARGMVVHESQSLLQEMQVCRGREFLTFAAPLIQSAFPARVAADSEAFSAVNLCALYTRVERGFIRVDADEVTYPAHVILRYDLERALIDGSLSAQQLPEAWDSEMRRYLGLSTAGNDRDGCLQDVHWPSGAFGYFPLYTLGAMLAAQLFATIRTACPTLPGDLERGDFSALNAWLGRHIWGRASSVSTNQLLLDATGEALNPSHFLEHLKSRYLA